MLTFQTTSETKTSGDIQCCVRSIIKNMVQHAVLTSPIKRTVSVAELTRVQHTLYKMAVEAEAKKAHGIQEKQG